MQSLLDFILESGAMNQAPTPPQDVSDSQGFVSKKKRCWNSQEWNEREIPRILWINFSSPFPWKGSGTLFHHVPLPNTLKSILPTFSSLGWRQPLSVVIQPPLLFNHWPETFCHSLLSARWGKCDKLPREAEMPSGCVSVLTCSAHIAFCPAISRGKGGISTVPKKGWVGGLETPAWHCNNQSQRMHLLPQHQFPLLSKRKKNVQVRFKMNRKRITLGSPDYSFNE